MSNNDTKFDWWSTESAPKLYPMKIIRGSFIYRGEKERGLYIPSGGNLKGGWGSFISSHVTGERLKPLPDRLKITFFSYAEKQFYEGEFELPYDEILALFRAGVAANPEDPTVRAIMAGIAPGGVVAVWVFGSGNYKEVFFGQAEKIEMDPSRAFGVPFKDKEDSDSYIDEILAGSLSAEDLDTLKNNEIPFDLWSRYRNRYAWGPTVEGGEMLKRFSASFVNGENEDDWTEIDPNIQRPVPRKMSFNAPVNGKSTIFEVTFDEFETMEAFEKLGAAGEKVFMAIEPKRPRTVIRIRLHNDKDSIQLQKFASKDW